MPIVRIFVYAFLCCLIAGCGTLRSGGAPEPSFDIDADLAALAKEFESATNITNYYKTPQAGRLDARDRFILGRLIQIDLRYVQYIRSLTADKQHLDSATAIAVLTLNIAGTLVGGVNSKANLAAAAAALTGTKAIIDKEYYFEKSVDALVATMNAKRKEVLVGILTGLSQPLDRYRFERALTDTQSYYLAGTLNGALRFIHTEAAQKEQKSDTELARIATAVIPTIVQVDAVERLTDSIGASSLTLDKALQALKALNIPSEKLPKDLGGAKDMLQDMVFEASQLRNSDARTKELARLTQAFSGAGILK